MEQSIDFHFLGGIFSCRLSTGFYGGSSAAIETAIHHGNEAASIQRPQPLLYLEIDSHSHSKMMSHLGPIQRHLNKSKTRHHIDVDLTVSSHFRDPPQQDTTADGAASHSGATHRSTIH
jgi:hypothetical protein